MFGLFMIMKKVYTLYYQNIYNFIRGYNMARDKVYDSYLKEYNKLAKKADRMMRELERFSRYEEFKSILNYAYRTAAADIEKWTPPGTNYDKPRWQRNAPLDTNSLKAKIKDIEKFIHKPTSTMTGVRNIYIKRTNTINRKYGTSFTWKTLADYFESGVAEKSSDKYGSKTVLVAIGQMQKNKAEVLKALEDKAGAHIQVDNVAVQNTINGLLNNYGYELKDIIDV